MAAKKDKKEIVAIDVSDPFNLDKLIDEEAAGLKLTPSNLIRGSMVKDAVSTGSLAVDLMTGGGFLPGMRSNTFGREQVGKTTFLYFAIKACILLKIHVIMYDFEGSTDADRIARIGVKINWFKELSKEEPIYFRYYDRMKHGEQAFRHAKRIMDRLPDKDEGQVQLVFCLDSLPAVPPEAQVDDDETGANAMRARLFSENLPLIKSRIAAKRCAWIDVNQLRTNPRALFGNPEYEPCGEAVRTLSDLRLKLKKTIPPKKRGRPEKKSYIEEEPCWDGFGMDRYTFADVTSTKNKGYSPFRNCIVRIWFEEAGQPGRGIDPVFDVYEYLRLTGQLVYRAKVFHISLPPFEEERTVKVEQWDAKKKKAKVDPKTKEVLYDEEKFTTWTWMQLKELILNPEYTKGRGVQKMDIMAACRKQINDGTAFDLYTNFLARDSMAKAAKKKKGDDDDDE